MLTASAAYRNLLTESHLAVVRVTALRRDSDGDRTAIASIPISDGQFVIDGQADTWRTLQLSCPNEYVSEAGGMLADVISAYDCDLRLEFGIQVDWDWDLGGPSSEYVQVGRLRVDRVVKSRLGVSVEIEASDDGARLADYELILPWPAQGDDDLDRNVVDTIKKIVEDCYPAAGLPTWVVDGAVPSSTTWPEGLVFQGDRWEAVRKLAEGIGCIVHNDHLGRWVIEPLPTTGSPVLTLDEGEGGVLTRSELENSREETFNGVGVRWERADVGSGLAFEYDNVPSSPTYWDGPFGRRSIIVDNDTVTDSTQAVAAAVKMLNQYKGRGVALKLGALYNPLLLPGDSIAVRTPTGSLETHIADKITIPIPAGEMALETRVVDVT